MAGPLGTATNSPQVDPGTMAMTAMPAPGPAGAKASAPAPAPAPDVIPGETEFHPGVSHGHNPCGKWAEIQKNPNTSDWKCAAACKISNPWMMAQWAKLGELSDKPLATKHLDYYLAGTGDIFDEDDNIENWISTDAGVQAKLVSLFPSNRSGVFTSHFEMEQKDYDDVDFKDAFGGIDIVDFSVDFGAGTVHVWFMDRYEWHPAYKGLYDIQKGDVIRSTNCLHAAMVELKSSGAADYWMKGEATVQLSVVLAGAASKDDDN